MAILYVQSKDLKYFCYLEPQVQIYGLFYVRTT